jgi:hypothetical protein
MIAGHAVAAGIRAFATRALAITFDAAARPNDARHPAPAPCYQMLNILIYTLLSAAAP